MFVDHVVKVEDVVDGLLKHANFADAFATLLKAKKTYEIIVLEELFMDALESMFNVESCIN